MFSITRCHEQADALSAQNGNCQTKQQKQMLIKLKEWWSVSVYCRTS